MSSLYIIIYILQVLKINRKCFEELQVQLMTSDFKGTLVHCWEECKLMLPLQTLYEVSLKK